MSTNAALKHLKSLNANLRSDKLDKLNEGDIRRLCASLLELVTVLPATFERLPETRRSDAMPEALANKVLPHLINDALPAALEDLDESVKAAETSANQILEAAETLMEKSESLGDDGAEISDLALQIMEACNFQDLTGQRATRVRQVLETTRDAFSKVAAGEAAGDAENPFADVYKKGPVNNGKLDQAAADALFADN